MQIEGLETQPYMLESLPDSFRYDRRIEAYGHNCGVEAEGGVFRSADTIVVDGGRPEYGTPSPVQPDLSFETLADAPIEQLEILVASFEKWVDEHWEETALLRRKEENGWDDRMMDEALGEAQKAHLEALRIRNGVDLLRRNDDLRRAFKLMNEAMKHSATKVDGKLKYEGWRSFQIAFLLSTISSVLRDDEGDDFVDTVWFATGGGKTETYLGLLVTAALYERIKGRKTGVTAWSRFPLRMLSMQQTQRFANALAGAELVRQREEIPGAYISLGYFVGRESTPNRLAKRPKSGEPDFNDPDMPGRYKVLLQCPFCKHDSLEMGFNRELVKLEHRCNRRGKGCPWKMPALPFYVVDDEIFRFLPTVVIGTLDKAALMGFQASIAGFFAPPNGFCSSIGHGHVYAGRASKKNGCLVWDCEAPVKPLIQPAHWYGLTMRLQDEVHLLRDSLGAVDSHYESLMDHVQQAFPGGARCKVIASSATLSGHDRQVGVLFNRPGRVFPLQGVVSGESFWSSQPDPGKTPGQLLRRYVAVAPRGVTHEFVSDRTVEALQRGVLRLTKEPEVVCTEAGIDVAHASRLVSFYGVNVVYGNTVRDVEAIRRSLEGQVDVGQLSLNAVTLTGNTSFAEVRKVLNRLEEPEPAYADRIHAVAASSMLSHGVDVERFNIMVIHGLPLTTAEFIQTTARVGRTYPGLVYVLHRMSRERDAASFRQFVPYVKQGDRFVEPVPVTRRSRRVLDLTLPGLAEARRLLVHERTADKALTMIQQYTAFLDAEGMSPQSELEELLQALGFTNEDDHVLRRHVMQWLELWEYSLRNPAPNIVFPSKVLPHGRAPMQSLRDVEPSAPIHTGGFDRD
ncbi:helicase C-terminal domain-containing protein [Streptomyces althioticus]|uniref:helicase C-terminal domain-containing protein n=1 Tax=Streptomyces althioticus TaxID=83380 RepID=UPI0033BB225A